MGSKTQSKAINLEITKYLKTNTSFNWLIKPIKILYDIYRYRLLSDQNFIKNEYRIIFNKNIDLKKPKTINEKMQWLKLYDRSPLHTKCADKYLCREYIIEKVGEEFLTPLVLETKNVKNINKNNLPNFPTVVKTNHFSGDYEFIYDKQTHNYKALQKRIKKTLKKNHYYKTKEWQYKNIEPRIIIEKLILNEKGKLADDYKFHCFHGKPKVVYVSIDREGRNKRNIYSDSWEPLHFTWAPEKTDVSNIRGPEIKKPKNYSKMLRIAETLSKDFKYVRIDLYNTGGRIYCGEITFHHGSGLNKIVPEKWDLILGDYLKLQ